MQILQTPAYINAPLNHHGLWQFLALHQMVMMATITIHNLYTGAPHSCCMLSSGLVYCSVCKLVATLHQLSILALHTWIGTCQERSAIHTVSRVLLQVA